MKSLIRQIQLCQPDIELSGLTAGDDIRPWGANLDKHYPRGKESLDVGKRNLHTPPPGVRPRHKKQTAKKLTPRPRETILLLAHT